MKTFTKTRLKKMGIETHITEACGFSIGDRVTPVACTPGTIIGFGPALHKGKTVFVQLDSGMGNHGDFHSCGNWWVEAAA